MGFLAAFHSSRSNLPQMHALGLIAEGHDNSLLGASCMGDWG